MFHVLIFGTHSGMAVANIFSNPLHGVLTGVKPYSAIQVACQSAHTFKPTIKSWLKLRSRRHYNLNVSQRVERLQQSRHYYLPVQSVEQVLMECSPEFV
jgi:hypothetical protein